jgi:VanZ family protein
MIKTIFTFFERHRGILWAIILFMTGITLYLTLIPPDSIPKGEIWKHDKLGHFSLFGAWTFFIGIAMLMRTKKHLPLISIFFIGTAFGISVEILQEILPVDRNADLYDILADMAGCLVAVILLKFISGSVLEDQEPLNTSLNI